MKIRPHGGINVLGDAECVLSARNGFVGGDQRVLSFGPRGRRQRRLERGADLVRCLELPERRAEPLRVRRVASLVQEAESREVMDEPRRHKP